MVNVANLLTNAARQHRERPALRYGGRRVTYGELEERAARFGSALLERGLVPGDRVALFMWNCPEYVVAMFGSFAAGLVVVPVNARLTAAEVAVILQDSGARALIYDEGHAQTAAETDTSRVEVSVEAPSGFEALLAEGDPASAPLEVEGEALAWLFYTSGTTGRPKGAMLSHRSLLVMTWTELADVCDYRSEDLVLHVAPLSHGSGLYLLGALARGAENLIYDSTSFDPAHVLSLVAWERVTVIAFVAPTMIVMLMRVGPAADTSSLRRVVYGGAPIHLDHAREMIRRFGPVFVQIYGQGEAPMTITYLDADAHLADQLLTSAGVPHPGIEVRLVDQDDHPVQAGGEGEVCVRGDVVMSGYWRNPEATARSLRGGWLHTGDLGRLDEEGHLFLLDRSSDTIISGGANIYPREVEEVLAQHEGVAEVVAFGVPDDLWGESVVAAVVPAKALPPNEGELVDFCRASLAGYKKPRRIVFLKELPKNAYGKVLRRELRERFLSDEAGG